MTTLFRIGLRMSWVLLAWLPACGLEAGGLGGDSGPDTELDVGGDVPPDVVPEDAPLPDVEPEDTPLPDVEPEDAPLPDVEPEDTPLPDSVPDDAPGPEDRVEPDEGTGPDDTTGPEDAGDEATEPDDAPPLPVCGNGLVELGEECDEVSAFCSGCVVAAPSGWFDCARSAGEHLFVQVTSWSGTHTWSQFRDHCWDVVDGLGAPSGAASWGLVAITDATVLGCITPLLTTSTEYWIGLYQQSSGSEPSGGWNWSGWNGTAWVDVAAYDSGVLPNIFDDAPGSTVDCGKLRFYTGAWQAADWACGSSDAYPGICAVAW